ncbi:MAG: hypothetical protein JO214_18395 [Frankiaceae bacterium]|nr:hypothetical protein [Frankiaceae bacterium]
MRSRRTALLAVATAIAVAGTAAPAGAAAPSWTAVRYFGGTQTTLSALSSVANGDLWAAGTVTDNGVAYPALQHFSNGAWHVRQIVPGDYTNQWGVLTAVAATSTTAAWVGGYRIVKSTGVRRPLIALYSGRAWTEIPIPIASQTAGQIDAAAARGPDDVWFAGTLHPATSSQRSMRLFHWDGTTLDAIAIPALDGTCNSYTSETRALTLQASSVFVALDCPDSLEPAGSVQRFDGQSWSLVLAPGAHSFITGLAATASRLWVVGSFVSGGNWQAAAWRDSGSGFEMLLAPDPTATELWGVAAIGKRAYAVGGYPSTHTPAVVRFTDLSPRAESVTGSRELFAGAITPDGTAYAAGPALGGYLGNQSPQTAVYRRVS